MIGVDRKWSAGRQSRVVVTTAKGARPSGSYRKHGCAFVGLRRIAPVIALRGNVDTDHWAERYPDTKMVRLGGRSIYVLHDIHELRLDPVSCGVDVVISGHSHRPRIETIRGVLYLNPGSAGPRRFSLPVTLAILEVTKSGLRPFIHHLGSASSD
ncbi:metallophosphoesterase family protein [Bradyrhizobium algeriense]|uniref:metallophosphoesterase family protein n=1 Tax=Bradyrhizobium algeriense TaxID=634784 RepID=UPI000D3B9ED3